MNQYELCRPTTLSTLTAILEPFLTVSDLHAIIVSYLCPSRLLHTGHPFSTGHQLWDVDRLPPMLLPQRSLTWTPLILSNGQPYVPYALYEDAMTYSGKDGCTVRTRQDSYVVRLADRHEFACLDVLRAPRPPDRLGLRSEFALLGDGCARISIWDYRVGKCQCSWEITFSHHQGVPKMQWIARHSLLLLLSNPVLVYHIPEQSKQWQTTFSMSPISTILVPTSSTRSFVTFVDVNHSQDRMVLQTPRESIFVYSLPTLVRLAGPLSKSEGPHGRVRFESDRRLSCTQWAEDYAKRHDVVLWEDVTSQPEEARLAPTAFHLDKSMSGTMIEFPECSRVAIRSAYKVMLHSLHVDTPSISVDGSTARESRPRHRFDSCIHSWGPLDSYHLLLYVASALWIVDVRTGVCDIVSGCSAHYQMTIL